MKLTRILSIAFTLGLTIACGGQEPARTEPAKTEQAPSVAGAKTPPAGKQEHVFRGKVEAVDANARTLMVNGENVEGWMSPMTMQYSADKPDVYGRVKVGDQITAKVYDGDFSTLYDVEVVK
jgi:copper binding protein CusF